MRKINNGHQVRKGRREGKVNDKKKKLSILLPPGRKKKRKTDEFTFIILGAISKYFLNY